MKYLCNICDKTYNGYNECIACEKSHRQKTFNIAGYNIPCYDRRSFDDYEKTFESKINNSKNRLICDIRNIDGYTVFYEMINGKGAWFYLEPESEYYCKWAEEDFDICSRNVTYHTSCGNKCTVNIDSPNGREIPDTCEFCGKPVL